MSFGLSFDKLLIIGIIAVFVLGPERLPHFASQLARLVRSARDMANGAKDRMREEMGPEFDDIDWRKLDPRQYDPRRIVREALQDTFDPNDPFGLKDDKPVSAGGPSATANGAEPAARPDPAAPSSRPPLPGVTGGTAHEPGARPYDPDAT